MPKQSTISFKELRLRLTNISDQVQTDQTEFVVFKKSKPVFRIVPMSDSWETIVDFTAIDPKGAPLDKVLAALKK